MHEYSNIGRTYVGYACSLAFIEFSLKVTSQQSQCFVCIFGYFFNVQHVVSNLDHFVIVTHRYLV